jgi:hypothetical protein
LTASFGQIGNDTLTCYTNSELKKIASRVIRANECDTLLFIYKKQMDLFQNIISSQSNELLAKDSMLYYSKNTLNLKERLLQNQSSEIDFLNKSLKKQENQKKWIIGGWIGTSIILTGIFTFVVLH